MHATAAGAGMLPQSGQLRTSLQVLARRSAAVFIAVLAISALQTRSICTDGHLHLLVQTHARRPAQSRPVLQPLIQLGGNSAEECGWPVLPSSARSALPITKRTGLVVIANCGRARITGGALKRLYVASGDQFLAVHGWNKKVDRLPALGGDEALSCAANMAKSRATRRVRKQIGGMSAILCGVKEDQAPRELEQRPGGAHAARRTGICPFSPRICGKAAK